MVMGELEQETEVLVIGSGPGGYAAAFRAADLGMDVTMVDSAPRPGGVCLYKGCIPSKTFLFLSELIHDAARAENMGITFGKPRIDLKALREWKSNVIDLMANGLVSLSNKRSVQLLQGRAKFESSQTARISDSEISRIKFRHAIIATGSRPIPFPGIEFKSGVEQVKADLRGWQLSRCLFVGDAGMVSQANLQALSRGGGKYIVCVPMRRGDEVTREVLARPGRYHAVSQNLRVKEVSGRVCRLCRSL